MHVQNKVALVYVDTHECISLYMYITIIWFSSVSTFAYYTCTRTHEHKTFNTVKDFVFS